MESKVGIDTTPLGGFYFASALAMAAYARGGYWFIVSLGTRDRSA
jgi:hypothetical protein